MTFSPCIVTLTALVDIPALEAQWRALEGSDRVSFFQSWDWIGSWLETLPQAVLPHLLQVRSDVRCVGLGLLSRGSARRRGVIRTQTLHLHETGVAEYDAITMEHNGLLTEPGFEQAVVDAAVHHLALQDDWDELYLGGMLSEELACWSGPAARNGLWQQVRAEYPHHVID